MNSFADSSVYKGKRKVISGKKYLSFFMYNEEYCIFVEVVKEIMGLPEITRLPQTPDFIVGVINLRGVIIPVIDLRKQLGLPSAEYGPRTCVIVVEFEYDGALTRMGIIVDETNEVVTIPDEMVSRIPYINAKIKKEYIDGIAEMDGKIKIILNITKVLGNEEFVVLNKVTEE